MLVCLDTNVVIYLIEANPVWTPKVTTRLNTLLAAGDQMAVCDAARLECLVKPLATGSALDEASYRTFFADPLIRMLPVTPATWERAARLSASYRLKAMDSVHLATAIEHGCGPFLTNDANLARCTDVSVEVLT